MAYFLPSFFQKRLLRYALSRLELVDTEALDLDSLGIRWGQRSSVELRDVGLKLEKITSLLHLPPSSELLSARVKYLRITVPADIYSSGIICEVQGVDVHLRLLSDETDHADELGNDPQHHHRHPAVHDPGGDQVLPTPVDLAESFLEAEPEDEKEELQAVLFCRSQQLRRYSSSISDEEEDGEEAQELGIGNEGLSLPSFVAGFLKGVADRLQVRINDVSVRVDMELKQDGPAKRQPENRPDLVTGVFRVGEVRIDAASNVDDEAATPPVKTGRRLIALTSISAMLISEPVVFSNYARFTVPDSPPQSVRPDKGGQISSMTLSPVAPASSESSSILAMTRSTILERPPSPTNSIPRPLEESMYTTADGRFSDAESELENRGAEPYNEHSDLTESQYDDAILDNPAYLDSVIDSHLEDDDLERSTTSDIKETLWSIAGRDDTRGFEAPPGSISRNAHSPNDSYHQGQHSRMFHSFEGDSPDVDHTSSTPRQSLSGPQTASFRQDFSEKLENSVPTLEDLLSHPDDTGPPEESPTEELSESKLFSHEEAQSMYMSAISQTPSSASFPHKIPGAWDSPKSIRFQAETLSQDKGLDMSISVPTPVPVEPINEDDDETTVATPKLAAFSKPTVPGDSITDLAQSGPSFVSTQPLSEPDAHAAGQPVEVAKTFLEVDQVLVWLPSVTKSDDNETGDVSASTRGIRRSQPVDPLHKSNMYASSRLRANSFDFESPSEIKSSLPGLEMRPPTKKDSSDLEVEVVSVVVRFDIATGWLLSKVGQKLPRALGSDEEDPSPKIDRPARREDRFGLKVSLDNLTVKFLDHLPGYAPTLEDTRPRSAPYHASEEVMLRLAVSGVNLFLGTDGGGNNDLRLDVARFVFGFTAEDVLSFNEDLKMRESTRDIMSPVHGDISLSIHKTKDTAKVSLATLPVHLSLNIQRLEEALTWVGGLSTILELGSSISSVSTVRHAKPEIVTKPKGVHFEATPAQTPQTPSLTWKVNSRIGGVVLDLIGDTQSIRLKTTAVKIVSRFEGVGVQIDKAKLCGPLSLDETDEDPAKITMDNIRIEYLFTPKEVDLDRLLALITPSKDKYDEDDDIMLDTLLRQRRQGSVLRATVTGMRVVVPRVKDLDVLPRFGNELSRLSTVAKYLPEDDRPGLLILSLIKDIECRVEFGGQIGYVNMQLKNVEAAHISIPSLVAAQVGELEITRNDVEELVQEAHGSAGNEDSKRSLPMLMARYIADEMDPTVKIKLHRMRVDYNTASVVAFLGMGDGTTGGDLAANMADSVANLTGLPRSFHGESHDLRRLASESTKGQASTEPRRLAVEFRDCILGLNPRDNPAQALIVLTNAKFAGAVCEDDTSESTLELRKATVMVIDDVRNAGNTDNLHGQGSAVAHSGQVRTLIDLGYVPVSYLSSAMAVIKVVPLNEEGTKSIDVELRDDLLILETCADSTQTLISVLNGLQPPSPPSKVLKYRTEVMPIQDMLASFTGDAFATDHVPESDSVLVNHPQNLREALPADDADEVEYVSDFYPPILAPDDHDSLAASIGGPDHGLLDSFHSTYHVTSSVSELDFREDHFAKPSAVEGTAHRWDSAHNTYGLSNDSKIRNSPLRVRVRDVHVIWNLFDGYDWQRTRDAISKAVKNVEQKAIDRRARARGTASHLSPGIDDEEESVIGDFLFNSIYIGIPANRDPRELNQEINRNIDDLVSETGSYATSTTVTGATARRGRSPSVRGKRLRLHRSRHHKMTFELKGISADLVVFPPGSGETQSSLDVRVNDLEIFDHVPTSTWKKFATYMHEAGEKESGTSMVHLEILTVKPVPELAASEIILKATVLPLRLHVDQDALDFMSRFFEFRDESATDSGASGDAPFLQRVEVNAVRVRLDFKPKRVDYAGLRSGRTTEFMNFFVLDCADMVLRHVIIYGVSGFDKLGQTLNDIWMPDVKRNQLPGVLAGLAPIRSLVNVGGGVKDLVVIPMREYKKDGRLVRSIQKGALAFAKTTTSELVKLGAKLAIGTQTVLQGAEELLNTPGGTQIRASEEDSVDEEEVKRISLYADQPVGVVQGLRGAFSSLERDLLMARDAIVAVPGEIVESGSAKAAAKAVLKRAPTVILRPAIGVSKAVGQTLLGAGNTLDPSNRRKMEDKYKRH